MSNFIHIKIMNDSAVAYLSKNIAHIVKKIQENESNEWIYTVFPQPMFIEKKYETRDTKANTSAGENINFERNGFVMVEFGGQLRSAREIK